MNFLKATEPVSTGRHRDGASAAGLRTRGPSSQWALGWGLLSLLWEDKRDAMKVFIPSRPSPNPFREASLALSSKCPGPARGLSV